jgi:hypothetical protein
LTDDSDIAADPLEDFLRAVLMPPVVDQSATDAVIAALHSDTVEPIPEVDECPKCAMSFVTIEQGVGLTFPIKVVCTCRICEHTWERVDE